MTNLPTTELDSVATINPRLSRSLDDDETVSFLGMADVSEDGTTSAGEDRSYSDVRKGFTPFRNGDILIAKITPCFQNGKIVQAEITRDHGFGSTEFHVVRTGDDLDPRYLLHYLRRPIIRVEGERRMTGSGGQRRVPTQYVKNLQIPLPSIKEQRRIAAILDHADALRAKRREALARLDELTQSIFIDMFGSPTTNPFGWETVACGELCSRMTVGIVVKPASYYQDNGVPALRSLNVRPNRVELNNLVFVSEEDNVGRLAKTRVFANDVVLVRSGQPGTAAVIPPELDGANAVDIIIASPDPERISPEYLARYFNSEGGRRMAMGESRGQVQQHLNVRSVAAARVPVPPIAHQAAFTDRIAESSILVAAQRTALAELDALFASLQSRAFRGEL